MASARLALEHGSTRPGRWLRARRLRVALLLAVAEGALVVLGVIPAWLALLVAVAVLAFHVFVGRTLRSFTARQLSWTAALSQLLVAFVPMLVVMVGVVALVAVGGLAVAAIVVLLAGRR